MKEDEKRSELSQDDISDLLASADVFIEKNIAQDREDIAHNQGLCLKHMEVSDWHLVSEFSEIIGRSENRSVLSDAKFSKETKALDLFDCFSMKCAEVFAGVDLDEKVLTFVDAHLRFYSHGKNFASITSSFVEVMKPLLRMLLGCYRSDDKEYKKIQSLELRWKDYLAPALAKQIITERVLAHDSLAV